tara:strand:+ start:212 stop:823 length:612 start_codon:yes stop_codon:yes gene_type:complete
MALAKSTELDAVNIMLSNIGEAPVNNITNNPNADVQMALNILREVSREIQSAGWHFNSDLEVPLTPDSTSKQITFTDNVARIDLEGKHHRPDKYDVVLMGDKLYDRKNRTYQFDEELKGTVVYLMDFTFLPEAARRYITIRAARIYQDRLLGSEKHHMFNRSDEQQAFVALREFELDTADYSIFDNYDVYQMIDRGNVIRRVQ